MKIGSWIRSMPPSAAAPLRRNASANKPPAIEETDPAESKQKRVELRVSDAFDAGLERLAQQTGLSKSEVVRRSVALYSHAKTQEEMGRTLGVIEGEYDPQSGVTSAEVVELIAP